MLTCLVVIEFFNLVIRFVKILPYKDPPLDEEIKCKLYS